MRDTVLGRQLARALLMEAGRLARVERLEAEGAAALKLYDLTGDTAHLADALALYTEAAKAADR